MNGSLGMKPGKMVAQAFHLGWMFGTDGAEPQSADDWELHRAWEKQGRRVVARVAETEHVFNRVCLEVLGLVLHDEGLTEVAPGSVTGFVSVPYTRAEVPKILTHKRCQLL